MLLIHSFFFFFFTVSQPVNWKTVNGPTVLKLIPHKEKYDILYNNLYKQDDIKKNEWKPYEWSF